MHATPHSSPDYALGDSAPELERLVAQGRFIGDLTAHVFQLAGISRGMRVLDIGSGAGDVSFLTSSIVGPDGLVIGVDRSPQAVAIAQQRAAEARLTNVSFVVSELSQLTLDAPVDAIVGRLVLMYFPNPADVLRQLLSLLKPGGVVVFQEIDGAGIVAEPMCEEFWTAGERISETFRRAGVDTRTGVKLPAIFKAAGLPAPQTLQMARVEHGADAQGYAWLEQLTRTLLPLMEQLAVATSDEVRVDSLATRIRDEAVAKKATIILPPFIGAWVRVPLDWQ
jgi:ubiquinone/menaquinone biosynthesis C-methylase UbiE